MDKIAIPAIFDDKKIYVVKTGKGNIYKLQKIDGVYMFVPLDSSKGMFCYKTLEIIPLLIKLTKNGYKIYEFENIKELGRWLLNWKT